MKSLAERIKILNSVSKTCKPDVSLLLSWNHNFIIQRRTPPLCNKMSNNLKTNIATLIFLSDFM